MTLPKQPLVLPAALVGVKNGFLTTADFETVPPLSGHLAHTPARGWRALVHDANLNTGHRLGYTGDPYRSYTEQANLLMARAVRDVPQGGSWQRTWNGHVWYGKPGTAQVATPGTSNHGLGRAVDMAWLDANGSPTIPITDYFAAWNWLVNNVELYGFTWEADVEPWHVAWYPGDKIPAAVLAFETPTPAPKVTDMTLIQGNATPPTGTPVFPGKGDSRFVWLPVIHPLRGYVFAHVGNASGDPVPGAGQWAQALAASGQKVVIDQGVVDSVEKITADEYQQFLGNQIINQSLATLTSQVAIANQSLVAIANQIEVLSDKVDQIGSAPGGGTPPNYSGVITLTPVVS